MTRFKTLLMLSTFGLLGLGVAHAQSPFKSSFVDSAGKSIGGVTLTDTPSGLLVDLDVSGLPPGEHGFHFHAAGRCDGPKFESAGDHFAPRQRKHGVHTAGGPHGGDMPNQFVGADGRLRATVLNTALTLKAGAASVLDRDGSALMLHAKADDYRSQPAGDSGDRIACAVIQRGSDASTARGASRP